MEMGPVGPTSMNKIKLRGTTGENHHPHSKLPSQPPEMVLNFFT
jgi:hypothetical protein